ncbi:MAG: DUF3179 domain-containing protein [Chloroflexi bacterium]|jgi:hypothetical protein|nr:DUF3179 domain-containing protein [Chloroflexota bacterium]MBT5627186.1 DUF3179 domain-containing protein [Chloroflexota bacterium]
MNQFVRVGSGTNMVGSLWKRRIGLLGVGLLATVLVACGGTGDDSTSPTVDDPSNEATAVVAAPDPTETPVPTTAPEIEQEPTSTPVDVVENTKEELDFSDLFSDDAEKSRVATLQKIWGWKTNFEERTIPLTELSIVLAKDKITPVDNPTFVSVADAPAYMESREPVVALIVEGDARAYPLAILMWHEIVNDTVGGEPVTVTFCPLCNTGITFSRIIDGQELTFGTSGMLRNSDLVMWDRQSESFWQQITGEALAGDFAANESVLSQLPSSIIAWETFAEAYPEGKLLERVVDDRGLLARPYDSPPYAGYDDVDAHPFLFQGSVDDRLIATSRVLTIDGEIPVAYPFAFLKEAPVINDSINDSPITAFFDYGTFSAFNSLSNEHQTSGSVAVFSRIVGDRLLTFEANDHGITDIETGSAWNYAGIATSGELEGTQLEPVVHANHFWFAWAVFKPATQIRDSLDDLG